MGGKAWRAAGTERAAPGDGPTESKSFRGRAARRHELLAAAERVIRRLGPACSMDDVAAEAGVTKPILYRHFGNKGGLYRALAERYSWALLAERNKAVKRARDDPRKRVEATIDAYIAFVENDPNMYRFLARHALHEQPEAHDAIAEHIRRVASDIAAEISQGLAPLAVDGRVAEPWAYGIVGMVELATDWWIEARETEGREIDGIPMTRQRFVTYLTELLWHGLSRPMGQMGSGAGQRGTAQETSGEQG